MTSTAELAVELTRRLPPADVERLATAVGQSESAVVTLRSQAGSAQLRSACETTRALAPSAELAGALRGAAAVRAHTRLRVDVVWGGPDSPAGAGRLTSAVITESIDGADRSVLVVGYAVHDEPSVIGALQRAAARGVDITLLCERPSDNPRFAGAQRPFPALQARRLAWPADARPAGASLHAKVLVIDERMALVGSANLTGAALGRNLECGLLVDGGPSARAIVDHVEALVRTGHLVRV